MLNNLFTYIFSENMALVFYLGMCTIIAISASIANALKLSLAVIIVQTITLCLNYFIYQGLLKLKSLGIDLLFLQLVIYIGVIASVVQILEMILMVYFPKFFRALGVFLPLITVNCVILSGSLFMAARNYDFLQTLSFAIGSSVGWGVAITLLAGIRDKLKYSNPPPKLIGNPLIFISLGLLGLIFSVFSGVSL